MTYQVLARTWRPQRFADLLGQDAVVQTLQNALSAGTVAHAYLFSGLRGVGKTTAARLLAKAVNCERGPTPEPCGECASCLEITDSASLDVVEIDAATHTQVEKIRNLQDFLRFRPTRDRCRIIIVDEVHMLSPSSFNALLKTIEEPPPYVLWIFATTERHKVPATILSRCQQLEFRALGSDLIATHLQEVAGREHFTLTPAAAGHIARAAGGSVRDALSLLDQLRAFARDQVDEEAVAVVLGVPRLALVARLVEVLAAGNAAAGLALLREELTAGRDATALYHETGRVLRVLLHLALGPDLAGELDLDQRALLDPIAHSLRATPLTRMLGLWLEHESLVREAANRELALEVAALRLSRWPAVQQVEAVLSGGTASAAPLTPPAAAPAARSGGARGAAGAPAAAARTSPPAQAREAVPASPPPAPPAARVGEEPPEPTPRRPPADPVLREAEDDPQVRLVRGILGGDIVAVIRDGDEL